MTQQKLLTIENAKTIKGEELGYLTGIIYMVPNLMTCPFSEKAGCLKSCLVSSGRGAFQNVHDARLKKREFFARDRHAFMEQVGKEIVALERKAKRENKKLAIRLNGTSDIPYENVPYLLHKNIFEAFPHIQFYDYTKIASRVKRDLPKNYDLTFSYSGTEEYKRSVELAVEHGARIAVVFRNGLPKTFLGKKVIDGDEHDLRFTEKSNVIVGLKAKGRARKDESHFIVDTTKLLQA